MKPVTHIFLINSQDYSYIFSVLVQTLSSPFPHLYKQFLKNQFFRSCFSKVPQTLDLHSSPGSRHLQFSWFVARFWVPASSRGCLLLGQALKMPNFPAHIRNCIYEPSLSPATVSLFLYSSEIRLGNEAGLSLLLDTTDVRKRLRT